MLKGEVKIVDTPAFLRLQSKLADYQLVSGKTNEQVLVDKGRNLATELYRSFRRDVPKENSIFNQARARGFRLGRKGAGAVAGISDTAWARAQNRMGGFKSILAQVREESTGLIVLRGVRMGKKYGRIKGGRRGLGGFAVSGTNYVGLRREGDVVLNFRAVQTIEELNLRRAGRRFLATSWLYRRWLQVGRGANRRTQLVNANPRSKVLGFSGQLGSVEFIGQVGQDRMQQALRLTSNVPGVAEIGQQRGRFANAIFNAVADIDVYLERKQREALQRAVEGRAS